MSTEKRCAESVHHGRMGLFNCTNRALPGDTLCGVHRAAVDRRTAAPRVAAPAATAKVEITRTLTVTLSWENGTGPAFRAPYDNRDTTWTWIRVSETEGQRTVDGRGLVLKKDGTPGQTTVDLRFGTWRKLPPEVQALFTAELEAAR